MTRRVANLLTIAALLALFAGVSFTAPRWARYFQQPLAALEEATPRDDSGSPAATPAPPGEPQGEVQRTINVKLFFEAQDRPGLVSEERPVPFSPDLPRQLRVVVEELIKGSQSGLVATLNPATRVLDVFITARGVAYVDLTKEVAEGQQGGSAAELLAVYSVVNSITENFPAVRRVQILVDDRPADTLAGHVDLSRPLPPDLTLLAAAAVVPAGAAPAPEGALAPSPAPPAVSSSGRRPAGAEAAGGAGGGAS